MHISKLVLKNWRNFARIELHLSERAFLIGPNASGKSNLLDSLRFLHDLVKQGGGLQAAVGDRKGVTGIRSLAARHKPHVEIGVELKTGPSGLEVWRYEIGIQGDKASSLSQSAPLLYERVFRGEECLLERPDSRDRRDKVLLTQTHLEQLSANREFRIIADFFSRISYLHVVPQLLKAPERFQRAGAGEDIYGHALLEKMARVSSRDRKAKLKRIEKALSYAVPQLAELDLVQDESGTPHLVAKYKHWRPAGGKQDEKQFSDGTLRLIGLFWSLMEREGLLLLEEPELSLHAGLVKRLPGLMHRLLAKSGRQVFISTHSQDLLSDGGVDPSEVFLLIPGAEGTEVRSADSLKEVMALLDAGLGIGEVVIPKTNPPQIQQLSRF